MNADRKSADAARRLAAIVRGEAQRVRFETDPPADPARVASGWTRRFVVELARAADVIATYHAFGYEACADPVRPDDLADGCTDCELLARLEFRVIYTRRLPPPEDRP